MIINEIKQNYKAFKEKKGDDLLIKIGIGGVVIGWILSISFIQYLFAWVLLFGFGMKLYDFAEKEQQRFEPNTENKKTLVDEIAEKYKAFKQNEGDNLLIKIGIAGVLIGWIFSISFIQHLFAWFILVGVAMKLFDYNFQADKTNTVKE